MIRIKQKWGLSFLLILSFIYIFIFFLRSNSNSEGIKEIYFADRLTAAHRILIEKYNIENEGKIKVVPIDFSNFDFSTNERKELLARSLRGRGDGIDLMAVDVIWVQRFAKWCEPLDKYFTAKEQNELLDLTMESCYFEGDLVAVPLDIVQGIIYYREDLIKQLDKTGEINNALQNNITWSDFIKLGEKLNSKYPFYIFPAADYEGFICVYMEILLGLEPDYFKIHGFNFNTQSAKKSLNFLVDLIHSYKLTPGIVTKFSEVPSYDYFIKNDGLFIRGWQSYDKDFLENPFDIEKEKNLKKMAMPSFAEGKPVSIFGGWHLMIPKFSDKKKEVIHFIKYLISESSQEIFYREAGYNPVIKKFYSDDKYLKKYPEIVKLKEIYNTGAHRPAHIEYTKYSKIMSHYFTLALDKSISVEEALNSATQDIISDEMLVK